jgi:hypothetical protein
MSQRQQLLNLSLQDELAPVQQKLKRYETILLRVLAVKGVFLLWASLMIGLVPRLYIKGVLGLFFGMALVVGFGHMVMAILAKTLLLTTAERRSEVGTEQAGWLLEILIATQYLGGLDDRMVGAKKQLEATLLELLPKLNEAQCRALTKAQCGYLRGWIKNGHREQQVAALLVLASAHDTKTIKHAQWLLQGSADTDPHVREAAREFLLVVGE